MLISLLACVDASDKEEVDGDTAEVGVDTHERGGDTHESGGDTADSEEGAWVPPAFECVLDNPLVLDAAALPSDSFLYGPSEVFLAASWFDLSAAADATGCPAVRTEGGEATFTGDCAAGGWEFSGTWVSERPYGDMLLTGVHAVSGDEWTNFQVLDADGSLEITEVGDDRTMETSLELHIEGMFGAPLDGDWRIERTGGTVADGPDWGEGHYSVATADGTTGDYCLLYEDAEGCDDEPSGGWAVQGDKLLVVTYDPEVSCDGCGNATLDGVPIGVVCR